MAVNSTSRTAMAPMTSFARRESVGTDTGGRMATSGLLLTSRAARVVAHDPVRGLCLSSESSQDNAPDRPWFPVRPAVADSFSHAGRQRCGGIPADAVQQDGGVRP